MCLDYIVWDVNPYIFKFPEWLPVLGGHPIAWYGLLWALSFVVGTYIVSKMFKREKLSEELLWKLFTYMIVSSVVGARLGHCLFYEPMDYLTKPWTILAIWEGGLASHGGAIGILIGLYIFSKKEKKPFFWTLDRIVVPAALGGCLIRLGNLLNSEIYGWETTLPWGFKFVREYYPGTPIDLIPACHPTQIYEAGVCLLTFAYLMHAYFRQNIAEKRPGVLSGVFLPVVFSSRILIEFLKQPQVAFENNMSLDMGQLLSIPFVIMGIWLLLRKKH